MFLLWQAGAPLREGERVHNDSAEIMCRAGCGACCIAPSISSAIPGMPNGKPAGVRCAQLTEDNRCQIFGKPERPAVCVALRPMAEMCRTSAKEAYRWLIELEIATQPSQAAARE